MSNIKDWQDVPLTKADTIKDWQDTSSVAPITNSDAITKLESLLRGGKQGVSMGFGDELTGAGESALGSLGLLPDKTYEQARDEARLADEAAQAANPMTYDAGQIAGGVAGTFLPGGVVATAGKGLTGVKALGAAAVLGAGAGGLSAAGESKAGVSDANLYKDVGQGMLVGGATGGVLKGLGMGASAALGDEGIYAMKEAAKGNSLSGQSKGILDQEAQKLEIGTLSDVLKGRTDVTGKAVSEAKNLSLLDDPKQLSQFLNEYADSIKKEFGSPLNDAVSSLRKAAANGDKLTPAKIQDLVSAVENNVKGAKLSGSGSKVVRDLESGISGLIPKTEEVLSPLKFAHTKTSTALDKFKKVAEGGEGSYSSDQTAALDKASAIANTFKNANKDATGAAANTVRDLEKVLDNPQELDVIKKLGKDVFLNRQMENESFNPLKLLPRVLGGSSQAIPTLKTADFAGDIVNKSMESAQKVANKLGANTALGKKVTDVLSMEPTARDRALFTLSQQPWFRSVSGPDDDTNK